MLGAPREIVDACANRPTSIANVPACELEHDEMVVQSLSVTEIKELAMILRQPIGSFQFMLCVNCK